MRDREIVALALGRIFRLASRPTQPGDVEAYEEARAIVLAHAPGALGGWSPSWVRDRRKGAVGD